MCDYEEMKRDAPISIRQHHKSPLEPYVNLSKSGVALLKNTDEFSSRLVYRTNDVESCKETIKERPSKESRRLTKIKTGDSLRILLFLIYSIYDEMQFHETVPSTNFSNHFLTATCFLSVEELLIPTASFPSLL